MQLYGLKNNQLIFVTEADKRKDYLCPECQMPIRSRGGKLRQMHFFHQKKSNCRQSSKSAGHLAMQLFLLKLLPSEEASMERPFRAIGRIADVCWEKPKIIFEIQCSHLSLLEAQQRCKDYQSLGYTVVWLLHDRIFNKRTLSQAEFLLRQSLCYYFHLPLHKRPFIYDQMEKLSTSWRRRIGALLPIVLQDPIPIPTVLLSKELPKLIHLRFQNKIYFRGDVVFQTLHKLTDWKERSPLKRFFNPYFKLLEILLKLSSS